MKKDTYYDAAHLMQGTGGSFARHIAFAWFYADSINRAILEEAFRTLFERYAYMAERKNQD